jgi:hypothetical protein
MVTALVFFSIFLLFIIYYQDYKYRAYNWVIGVLLGLSFTTYNLLTVSLDVFLNNVVVNIFILFIQFGLVLLMLSIKEKRLIKNFTNEYMGIGDVVLFLNLCFLFSTLNFIFFMVASLVVICFGIMIFRIFQIEFNKELPFGGLQSLCLIAVLLCTFLFKSFSVNNDFWILTLIGNE